MANTINSNTDKSHQFYMNSKTLIHFEFTDVDENTVIDVLRQLPLKSSFGFDGISSHLLHNIELYLVKPLTLLAKQTLNSGFFPEKLKIAKVIPIFKKGDSTQFTNYRPISLLPVISKVGLLEKIILFIQSFIVQHNDKYNSSEFHNVLCTIVYNACLHMSRIQFESVYRSYFFISAVVLLMVRCILCRIQRFAYS